MGERRGKSWMGYRRKGKWMAREGMYLSNWFPIGDAICGLSVFIAGLKGVAYECWAEGFNHEVVVVEGCDGGRFAD
jgi:hypothetical protein